ncbi:Niemann-Pick C1-like protein 1, partial [Numida meleagris]|uniref:Niemann-Pick C1-like protein 1 n=1 Tax=Numida meleagris TaxID=8996 RepID=UPI000B3DB791
QQPCTCQDCAGSCPPLAAPPGPADPFLLGSADGALVICALLFAFFALVFLTAITCARHGGNRSVPITASTGTKRSCASRLSSGSHRLGARLFRRWGTAVASHPVPVLVAAAVVTAGLAAGLHRLELTTDPVELWSAPGSQARTEKAFHDRHFGPFMRTCQVIVTARGGEASPYRSVLLGTKNFSAVLSAPVLRALLELQEELANVSAWVEEEERAVTLRDVCYAPLNPGNATAADCCVNSVTQYFQNNRTRLEMTATQSGDGESGTADWRDHLMYCVKCVGGGGDARWVWGGSYEEMGGWVGVMAIGSWVWGWRCGVRGGWVRVVPIEWDLLVVLGAVVAAMGFLALLGLPSSLIILEVVPFLVLAVGADNIFIFVQEFQQSEREEGETREQHIGRVLAQVAPSMMLCSVSEVICFCLGERRAPLWVPQWVLNGCPKWRQWWVPRGIVQWVPYGCSCWVSRCVPRWVLNGCHSGCLKGCPQWMQAGRYDCCCCCGTGQRGHAGPGLRLLRPFLRRFYTPVLLHRCIRPLVVLLFLFFSFAGLYLMLQVEVGLDQELAMPTDSYMLPFFSDMVRFLQVGVPTYFVTTGGYNFSSPEGTNGICSSAGCDNDSLTQTIQRATQFPNVSYLAIPATSWVDDFLDWLNPTGRCCRIHRYGELSGQFCPSTSSYLRGSLWDALWGSQCGPYGAPRGVRSGVAARCPRRVTYVYYEQYLTVVAEGLLTVAMCLAPTFLVSFVLLGMDLRSSAATVITIAMILLDTVGLMTLWGIPYNAVALI